MPDYTEVNAQVLQDVILRVDRAFQAFFRRVKARVTPGYPRFQGRDRYHSFTYPQVGEHGGAALDGGIARWKGRPKRSRSREKPTAGMRVSLASMCPFNRFPPPDSRPA
jgi:transposase